MRFKSLIAQTLVSVVMLLILVIANIIGARAFVRLDLTREKQFTLGEATRQTLAELKYPITVKAYFSGDMPYPYSNHMHYARDVLEEYYNVSGGKVRFEFIDPTQDLSFASRPENGNNAAPAKDAFGKPLAAPSPLEEQLVVMGIPPVQVQINSGDKLEIKKVYMGVTLNYADKREVIPVVGDTAGFEYLLTTQIRKLTRTVNPRIGVVTGFGGLRLHQELSAVYNLLSQTYELRTVDLAANPNIPAHIETLLLLGPSKPFTVAAQRALDNHIAQGKSIAFFLSSVKPNLAQVRVTPTQHGLEELLFHYGAHIDPGLVLDADCSPINVTRQVGHMQLNQPIPYPYIPEPRHHPDVALTRGLGELSWPFTSPLRIAPPAGAQIAAEVLIRSSDKAWIRTPPYRIDADQDWQLPSDAIPQPYPLAVSLAGQLPLRFSEIQPQSPRKDSRLILVGGATFLTDMFFNKNNEAFLLNSIDWLLGDDALLSIRNRGLRYATLTDLSPTQRAAIKYSNIAAPPSFCALFGLLSWRWRERRRSKVSAAWQQRLRP